MNRKRLAWMTALAAALAAAPGAWAQAQDDAAVYPAAVPTLSEPQLEQLAAPIALYPDALIAWVLRAATHPLDVVEAHRWMLAQGGNLPTGEDLAAALRDQPWDASVKTLVPIPHVIEMLDGDLAWTRELGDVYRTQEPALMDAIQALRHRAEAAGTLQSSNDQSVVSDGQDVLIYPAYPDLLPVPYYNPNLAYGDWPWTDYPPFCFTAPFDSFGWGPTIVFQTVFIPDLDEFHHHDHHRHHHWIDWRDHRVATAVHDVAAPARAPGISRTPDRVATVGGIVLAPESPYGAATARALTRVRPGLDPPRQPAVAGATSAPRQVVRMPSRLQPAASAVVGRDALQVRVAPGPRAVVGWPVRARPAPETPQRVENAMARMPRTVIRDPAPRVRASMPVVRAPMPVVRAPAPVARVPEPVFRPNPAFRESRIEAPALAARPSVEAPRTAFSGAPAWRGGWRGR